MLDHARVDVRHRRRLAILNREHRESEESVFSAILRERVDHAGELSEPRASCTPFPERPHSVHLACAH
jgi:hypothetical protein